jgi:glucose-1-phosphate cytidylyltransferase
MTAERKNIPVVIFCGGKGTRLKEETEYKPKPMVNVGGRPILWHIMKHYSHYGYRTFVLCLGYKGNYIKEFFLNHKILTSDFRMEQGKVVENYSDYNDDFEIIFADTGEDAPTGERLKIVEKYITTPQFMVTYGDGVSNIDIDGLVDFHNAQGTMGTISGVHPTSKYGLVRVDDSQKITAFEQKPMLHDYVNGGFMVFQKEFFQYLKEEQMVEDAMRDAVRDNQLSLYRHDGFWQSMDTYQDVESLNEQWQDNPQWRIWE